MKVLEASELAINGGQKAIDYNMPPRKAFSKLEIEQVNRVVKFYEESDSDPGYNGIFEKELTDQFSDHMGGGYSVAVGTGTASVYVALAALNLPAGSHVIISPVTDAGPINSIIMQGLVPVVADSGANSYNTNWAEIEKVITDKTACIMLVHCGGLPVADVRLIQFQAQLRGIKLLEDCSQAPGAIIDNQLVGSFGDIMATSTMYRKNIASAGSGGLIFTKDKELYHQALAHSDRGKPLWDEGYIERDPSMHLFPALNWNTNEFSCAITSASLARLSETISKRNSFLFRVSDLINSESRVCYIPKISGTPSSFFHQVFIHTDRINCSKLDYCRALQAEGIDLNPDYKFLIADWKWSHPYIDNDPITSNAISARNRSFNLYLNENYIEKHATDIVAAILKVDSYYSI